MGFLLWKEGSGSKGLRMVVRWNFLFQVFVRWPGVTLKGLRGVANTVDVEESCVLDVKSGIALIISSDRVLVFNCTLKGKYLFCK